MYYAQIIKLHDNSNPLTTNGYIIQIFNTFPCMECSSNKELVFYHINKHCRLQKKLTSKLQHNRIKCILGFMRLMLQRLLYTKLNVFLNV